jgi:hypothetical protein
MQGRWSWAPTGTTPDEEFVMIGRDLILPVNAISATT